MYYYDELNLRFYIKRVRYQNTTKESVSILLDIACRYLFLFALDFFGLAAVDSKTPSRARDRENFNSLFLMQKLAISEPSFLTKKKHRIPKLHNKRKKERKNFWTFTRTQYLKCLSSRTFLVLIKQVQFLSLNVLFRLLRSTGL